jgi:hypothetical protein
VLCFKLQLKNSSFCYETEQFFLTVNIDNLNFSEDIKEQAK